MTQASINLTGGFRLNDCLVFPDRNAIARGETEEHVEPKAMQVLVALASRPGSVVTREELLDAVWPETYSGDAALTRCVSILRSTLGDDPHQPRYIETVSKSGYRLLAPVSGPEEPRGATSWRRPALIAAVVVSLLAIAWLSNFRSASHDGTDTQTPSGGPSIAILPFVNLSTDASDDYLSDGIAEEILNRLAQAPSLRVISRSSSFSFRSSDLPARDIAASLGVEHLLEGSVRRAGDRVRVIVQLTDAGSGEVLWSDAYEPGFADLLSVQDEVARAVVDTLSITLDFKKDDVLAVPAAAHEALLRGRFLAAQRTQASLESAVDEFSNAILIEPRYALAQAELAMAYLLLRRSQYGTLSETEAIQLSMPHAEQAMRLDPKLAEAHAAAGLLAWRLGNSGTASDHFETAIGLNPNYALVHHWLAMLSYRHLGKHEEALAASETARRLDPVSVPISTIYVQILAARGRLDEAERELQKIRPISESTYLRLSGLLSSLHGQWSNDALGNLDVLRLDPTSSRTRNRLMDSLIPLGALSELAAFEPITSPRVLAYLERFDDAVQISQENYQADRMSVTYLSQYATALAYRGDYSQAGVLLEELWQKAEGRVTLVNSGLFTLRQAVMLYAIRLADANRKGARDILSAMLQEARNLRQAGVVMTRTWGSVDFSEGLARYLSGETPRGLELMRKAVDDGYFVRIHPPLLPALFDDPAFLELLEKQAIRQAQQRDKLYSVVCRENPYEDAWAPLPENCQAYLADY